MCAVHEVCMSYLCVHTRKQPLQHAHIECTTTIQVLAAPGQLATHLHTS
jgi:hypothetical protein